MDSRQLRTMIGITLAMVLVSTALVPGLAFANRDYPHDYDTGYRSFDVAERGNRFAPSSENLAYGTSFVTQGFIYPHGFLDHHDGVDEQGNATYPARVIGTWTCFGWIVTDDIENESGRTVVTTQVYEFKGHPGRQSLVSEGFELGEIGAWVKRAITGGTGHYVKAGGAVNQKLLAFPNVSGGVNLRFQVKRQ